MRELACINVDEKIGSYLENDYVQFKTVFYKNLSVFFSSTDTSVLIINLFTYDSKILKMLSAIKALHPSLAVVVSSEKYIEQLAFWCLRNKMLDYILLPKEIDHLKNTLKSLGIISNKSCQEKREPLAQIDLDPDYNEIYSAEKSELKTKNAIRYIHHNYHSKIKIETLAAQCNYSVAAFSSIFKKENGKSTTDFINGYRVDVAKRLLTETVSSVSSVATRCGFDDASYFVKVFKNIEKVTPANFRKNL